MKTTVHHLFAAPWSLQNHTHWCFEWLHFPASFGRSHFLILLLPVVRRGEKEGCAVKGIFSEVFVSRELGDIVIAVPVTLYLSKGWEFADCSPPELEGCPVPSCVFYTLTSQFLKQEGNSRWVQFFREGCTFIKVVIQIIEKYFHVD